MQSVQENSFLTLKQFHALISKHGGSKIAERREGNADHVVKIPSKFVSCTH